MTLRSVLVTSGCWAALLAAAPLLSGCAPKGPEPLPVEATAASVDMGQVAGWYNAFATARRRAPNSREEFIAFVEKMSFEARGCEVEDIPRLMVSVRDKQEFVIRTGISLARQERSDQQTGVYDGPVVVHEKDGVGGKRFVSYFHSGRFELVDDARFQELVR